MAKMPVTLWLLRNATRAALLLLFCATATLALAQTEAVVCIAGSGSFGYTFRTGVSVDVGAARRDGLATRMCQATLRWDKGSLVVAGPAAQVDIDGLGIDLSLKTPVVTFQVKRASADCCRTFLVYSLEKPPKLLRTIEGGGFFRTADTNLNGTIEIWTSDAAAMQGFESPNAGGPELAPTVVLRFDHGRLLDAGAEFQGYFDGEIAKMRSQLDPEDLRNFKNSDGRLAPTVHFSEESERLSENEERTKIKVLSIVCSYLYSGREQNAWSTLAEMWPTEDFQRIKAEILRVRDRGILSQVDGTSNRGRPPTNTAEVFDLRTQSGPPPKFIGRRRVPVVSTPPIVAPIAISITHNVREGESEADLPASELLDLTIDVAGKVRSLQSDDPSLAALLRGDMAGWRFIPAMNDGRAVTSRIYLYVSPER